MAGILEYSTTAASNTTLNGIGIAGSNSVKNGDDALRQLMADAASAVTQVIDKSANYTAVKADYRQMIRATATMTLNLTVAATLTAGWCLWVKADGGAVTVDPAGTEKINGANTLTLVDGSAAFIVCTGTAFQAIIFNAAATLGDAAYLNVGTTAGTVAAGDDSRIVGAVQKDGSTGLKGYTAAAAADDGNIAGTTYEPSPLTLNWRKVTNNGAGTFKAPTTAGCYSMTVRIINTASAGAVTFTGFTAGFPKGDALTLSATGVFDVFIQKMDNQCTANIEQVLA
jgi:hypothetical protein